MLPTGAVALLTLSGWLLGLLTRNFTTSYMSLAPRMAVTWYSLPWASMMTARVAPLKGVKLLTASPLAPV